MTLAMAPLIILFELSILLARWIERIKPVPVDGDDGFVPDDAYDGEQEADTDRPNLPEPTRKD